MEYRVNGVLLTYGVENESSWGVDEVLSDKGIDLTKATGWHKSGLVIDKLFKVDKQYSAFKIEALALLRNCWKSAGLDVPDDFDVTTYHQLVHSFPAHAAAIEKTKLLQIDKFPGGIRLIEERISEICGASLMAQNPFDNQSIFHFRIIRPGQKDNNPLHRDVWLEDYDDCINLYIPIAGSNANSSLILIPGSHLWSESRVKRTIGGAEIGGLKFNVPAVTDIKGEYEVVRPVPNENEVLVFSPYLIHGGAVNLNEGITRISIELRLWKRS